MIPGLGLKKGVAGWEREKESAKCCQVKSSEVVPPCQCVSVRVSETVPPPFGGSHRPAQVDAPGVLDMV